MTSSAPFDSFIPSTLLVLGDAPEVAALAASHTVVCRAEPDAIEVAPRPFSALVLDARSFGVDVLAVARARPWLSDVPVLALVDSLEDADEVAVRLRADDVIATGCRPRDLERRLLVLLALGRARLGMSFAAQALEHSVSALSIADVTAVDHPLVHVSPIFEEITGYAPAEVLGKNCRFLQGPRSDPAAVDTMRAAVAARKRVSVVLRNHRSDGSPFWNEVTLFPVEAQGATLRWMGGLQHDATALVEARSRIDALSRLLSDRQQVVRTVLDGVEVGILTTDAAGAVTFVNRAAASALGTPTGHVGRDVQEVLGLGRGPGVLLADAARVVIAHAFTTPDGAVLDLELTISRADGSTHDGEGYFCIFRDVGVDKQREQERRRLERLAAVGTMVAGFAHEVRNPLAALQSLAESLDDDLNDVELRMPQVGRMKDVLERLERLVRTSLQFGRPDRPRLAAYRPWEIASQALSSVSPRTRAVGVPIRVEVESDLPDVIVDQAQLVQVLVILLDNALDAAGDPRRVTLRASSVQPAEGEASTGGAREVRFEVEDAGPGIPAEIIGSIFDPFFTTKASGTGLGLSIAQQLVSENRGRLEVASTRDGPTVFTLVFDARRGARRADR